MRKLIRSLAMCFNGMKKCISRDFPKWFSRKISVMEYFGLHVCRKFRRRLKRGSRSRTDISVGERVVLLNAFLPARVRIYTRQFTPHRSVLLELVKAQFESADGTARFEKRQQMMRF